MKNRFDSKKFRDGWVAVHVKRGLATQLRELRGSMKQGTFGEKIGKPQSVVARLEDPNYGSMTTQTLLDIASKLDIGLLVKFVPFSRLIHETGNLSHEDLAPPSYTVEKKAFKPGKVLRGGGAPTPARKSPMVQRGEINAARRRFFQTGGARPR